MTTPKLGIENVKKFVGLGFAFGEQISTAMADGKFTVEDAFGFLDELMQISVVAKVSKEALAEALDLDAAERTELNSWAATEFDIPNDQVEEKVEASLDLGVSILMAYKVFKPKPNTSSK